MSRPSKPTQTKTGKIGKAETEKRKAIESAVRGKDDKLTAPDYLSDEEKKVYNFILDELKDTRILSNVDVLILENFCVAVVELRRINNDVRENGSVNVLDKNTLAIRNSYKKDFDAGVKELALSPQARAKIGTLTIAAAEKKADPVLQLLGMTDE